MLLERRRLVDHPGFGWLFENGAVWAIALTRTRITSGASQAGSTGRRLLQIWAGILVSERLQLGLHHALVARVYSHIPYFHPGDYGAASPAEKDTGIHGVPRAHGGFTRILAEWCSQ